MKEEKKKICHYLDMPIQHSSDRILKKMGRRTNRKELLDKIEMLRTEIPDIFGSFVSAGGLQTSQP